jgi:hypothetical protein
MNRETKDHLKFVNALSPSDTPRTADTAGAIIDTTGYERAVFAIRSKTCTDGTFTAKLEEGDDPALSDAALVPSTRLNGTLPVFTSTDSNKVQTVEIIKFRKKYARLTMVETVAATTGQVLDAMVTLGEPKYI